MIANQIMDGLSAKEIGITEEEYRLHCQLIKNRGGEPALPNMVSMAKNVAQAVSSAAKRGAVLVDDEEKEKRLKVCRQCEFYRTSDKRCAVCGCYTELKTTLASWHCPIGRW
jgi:ribosomal protein L32